MDASLELIKLANFIRAFRKAVVNKRGICFVNRDMCILNETYYIYFRNETIEIRSEKKEIKLSNTSDYYQPLKNLFEDIYFRRESKRRLVKRIDLLLVEVRKRRNQIVYEAERRLKQENLKSWYMF